jgi:hypothetical protein
MTEPEEGAERPGCPINTDDLTEWPDRPKGSPPIRRVGVEYPDDDSPS